MIAKFGRKWMPCCTYSQNVIILATLESSNALVDEGDEMLLHAMWLHWSSPHDFVSCQDNEVRTPDDFFVASSEELGRLMPLTMQSCCN